MRSRQREPEQDVSQVGEGAAPQVQVAEGRLDLGPWQQVFYCEFDGGRPKRMIIKVLGG